MPNGNVCLVMLVFVVATTRACAGVPGQLPNIAMGWILLFHIERATALLGVIGVVLLIGWRAIHGDLPIKLGNVEYEAKRAAADAGIVAEEQEHRIRVLEVLAGLRRPEELDVAKIIARARRELPERDRRYQEAIEGLRRVARDLPGRPWYPAKS